MHKFLAFILTVGGSLLIMSSVTFAQDTTTSPDPAATAPVIEKNVLPLGNDNYDRLLIDNRASRIINPDAQSTGDAVRDLFVVKYVDQNGNVTYGPSTLVRSANIIVGVVALIFLMVSAIKFIVARGDEEKLNTEKKNFAYILLGLIMVAAAVNFAFWIFNPTESANFLTDGQVDARFNDLLQRAKVFIQIIIVAVAAMSLVISGYELLVRQGTEDSFTKEKEFLRHFLLAAGLIMLSEVIVRFIFAARNGGGFDSRAAREIGIDQIMGFVNFMLGLVTAAATLMLVLASLYYVISLGDEERAGRAKRIIFSSIIGIIIAVSAYTIIAYFARLYT